MNVCTCPSKLRALTRSEYDQEYCVRCNLPYIPGVHKTLIRNDILHLHDEVSYGVRPRSLRIKRNDPCVCGSGKKFKNCCFGKKPGPKKLSLEEKIAKDIEESMNNSNTVYGSVMEIK